METKNDTRRRSTTQEIARKARAGGRHEEPVTCVT